MRKRDAANGKQNSGGKKILKEIGLLFPLKFEISCNEKNKKI